MTLPATPHGRPKKNHLGTLSLLGVLLAFVLVGFVAKDFLASFWLLGINLQALLEAACEAALVGACADWFAVSALFRHPFGLPIPHTRILPHKKPEIADGVKDMVATFLTPQSVGNTVEKQNFGHLLFNLVDRGREKGVFRELLERLCPVLIHELRQRAILGPLVKPIARYLEAEVDYARTAAKILKFMSKKNLDDKFMDFAAAQAYNFIAQEKAFLAKRLVTTVAKMSGSGMTGRVKMWFVKRILNEQEAEAFIAQALPLLEAEMHKNGDVGSIRSNIKIILDDFTDNLEKDVTLQNVVNLHTRTILKNLNIEDSLRVVNSWTADYLEAQLNHPEAQRFGVAKELLERILDEMRSNPTVIHELDIMIKRIIQVVLDSEVIVSELGNIARMEVLRMSDDQLVTFIEERVGNDLQYIRVNGALIGGLVGALLYCLKNYLAAP